MVAYTSITAAPASAPRAIGTKLDTHLPRVVSTCDNRSTNAPRAGSRETPDAANRRTILRHPTPAETPLTEATNARRSAAPAFPELLDALFVHLPGSTDGQPLRATEISTRTGQHRTTGVSTSHLSLIRSGRCPNPSFDTIAALADAFGIDIAFFTHDFHHQHTELPMRDRVRLADTHLADAYRTAAAIYALPNGQRAAVLALLDILTAEEP